MCDFLNRNKRYIKRDNIKKYYLLKIREVSFISVLIILSKIFYEIFSTRFYCRRKRPTSCLGIVLFSIPDHNVDSHLIMSKVRSDLCR